MSAFPVVDDSSDFDGRDGFNRMIEGSTASENMDEVSILRENMYKVRTRNPTTMKTEENSVSMNKA